jgi:CelD/BcsL family acetyltransferase involved in cellulose biosynthesis
MNARSVPRRQPQVRVLDSWSQLTPLADAWETLSEKAAVTSVFATYDWQRLWWEHYARGRALRVLVAATRDDGVVGILPLYIDEQPFLRYPVRFLRFVGSGGDTRPDDLGPLLLPGFEVEAARALAEAALRLAGWDVLMLADMDPECVFAREMASAARRAHGDTMTGRCERIAYLDLPASYDAWLASLSRDRRYRTRKIRRNAQAAHAVRFFVWDDPATIDEGIDALVKLHQKRWQRAGEDHRFSTPQYTAFHRAAIKASLSRDRLRLYCLTFDDIPVAVYYFYRFRDRVFLFQAGFDPDHADLKPGQVLLGYVIEHAIGEGMKVLDFLRGEHRYKDEIATGERETVYVTVFRRRPGAWIYRVRGVILPRVKARVVHLVARLRAAEKPGPET